MFIETIDFNEQSYSLKEQKIKNLQFFLSLNPNSQPARKTKLKISSSIKTK